MKMPPDVELNKFRDELNPAFRALTTKIDKELSASLPKGSHHSAADEQPVQQTPTRKWWKHWKSDTTVARLCTCTT